MILTTKIKHSRDFSDELEKARKIAEFAVETRTRRTSDVKHFGLKADASQGIINKYSLNRKAKRVTNVKLTFNGQRRYRLTPEGLYIPSIKLLIPFEYMRSFEKVNQVEVDDTYAYVSVTVPEAPLYKPKTAIGIDRNTTGHCVVAACPTDGSVFKLGKSATHIRTKYSSLLRHLQRKRRVIKSRESHIMRDMNHKIAKKLVDEAIKRKAVLVLEDLKGIRRKTRSKKFGRLLNSWSYYQLQEFIEYKAKLRGVPVAYIDPRYTSQQCGRCGLIGTRQDKNFHCHECGNVEHADVNAAFVIALRHMGVLDCPETEIKARAVPEMPKGIGL